MRALGIDPGTGNFDFCCIEDDVDKVVLDETIPSSLVAHETDRVMDLIKSISPDVVVGPSGYGLEFKKISDLKEEDLALTTLEKKAETEIPVLSGVRRLLRMMQAEGLNAFTVPGVIQLPTVPHHRKVNKIDLGTADKTCVTAYAVWDQAKKLGVKYDETRLVCLEMGLGYNAAMAVENGKIVDGIGGTIFPGPGYLALGMMDGELAYLLGDFSKKRLFEGGVAYLQTGSQASLEEFISQRHSLYGEGWTLLLEGVVKAVAALMVAMDAKPYEVIITGRISRADGLRDEITAIIQKKLGIRCRRPEHVFANKAKDVAMGAALIANGVGGGKYSKLVETLELTKSSGTVLDYVRLPGFNPRNILKNLRSD
ncbi:MAG: DUF1464 family protein [Candidatus Caldarchaeum sp.]